MVCDDHFKLKKVGLKSGDMTYVYGNKYEGVGLRPFVYKLCNRRIVDVWWA